jgi:hypothetical protein
MSAADALAASLARNVLARDEPEAARGLAAYVGAADALRGFARDASRAVPAQGPLKRAATLPDARRGRTVRTVRPRRPTTPGSPKEPA